MALQGVQGNLFELMMSPDKKVQDFIGTLKQGDALRGRVVDIIQGENRAIINFKGYNMVSQLPQDTTVQKGDIVNVQVSQVSEKVFMKLVSDAALMGKGVEMQQNVNNVNPQQLANLLSTIKVPVNEQTIFISQKLIDYHLPVTKENIADISNALNRYMADKGVDASSVKNILSDVVQNPVTSKEIALQSFVKLNTLLNQANETLQSGKMNSGAETALKQNVSTKIMNMINTVNMAARSSGEISLNVQNNSVIMTLNNLNPENVNTIINQAVKENVMTPKEGNTIIANFNSNNSQPVSINNGTVTAFTHNNSIVIQLNNLNGVLENVVPRPAGETADAARNLAAKLFTVPQSNPEQPQAVQTQSQAQPQQSTVIQNQTQPQAPAQPAVLPQGSAPVIPESVVIRPELMTVLNNMKPAVDSAVFNANLIQNGSSEIPQVFVQSLNVLNSGVDRMNNVIKSPENYIQTKPDAPASAADGVKGEVVKAFNGISDLLNNPVVAKVLSGQPLTQQEVPVLQQVSRELSSVLSNLSLFKAAEQTPAETGAMTQNISKFDVEAAIESLAFLKSRNISIENNKYVDIMNKYFSNDMKLNQGMERLANVINQSKGVVAQPAFQAAEAQPGTIAQTLTTINTLLSDVSVRPQPQTMNSQVFESQVKNFIENSGLNIESKVKDMLVNQLQNADNASKNVKEMPVNAKGEHIAPQEPGNNLKSMLIKLDNQLNALDSGKMSPQHRETANNIREAANDILSNLNALQFLNQRPVSFDMLYTQIPVFLDNKFFNGEVQVWYRKGSLQESLDNAEPVNLVFMLNTSKLGNVKIQMTIYKNDVETIVKTDNEKAKQILTRNRNEFLEKMDDINFNMKSFAIMIENQVEMNEAADGYINLGNVNFSA